MNSWLSKYFVWYPIFFLRGQRVRSAISAYEDTQYFDEEHLREIQFRKFRDIIYFAYKNIPFYSTKYNNAKIVPEDIRSFDDIHQLPMLTKQEILENSGTIYNKHYSGKKFRRSTSGSTGIPLIFYKDAFSMTIMDAILYRNYSWMGVDIGFRQARFWGHPLKGGEYFKVKLLDTLLNRLRLSPYQLEERTYTLYLKQLERFNAQYIYGYAQSVFQFSQYFHRRKIDLSYLNLKAVILTGEMIFPDQLDIIKTVFNCYVTEEYGCTEVGVIGFKCEHENMHLMENLLVENVPSPGKEPAGNGNIIVSELYGNLFPFIRYDVGDRGTITSEECPCERKLAILKNLSGRKDEFVRCPNGKLTDPYVLEYIINDMPDDYGQIFQFRIIQKNIDYIEVLFVAEGNLEKIREYIQYEFGACLSADMNIEICFVSSLEKDPSGKLRCFISELM